MEMDMNQANIFGPMELLTILAIVLVVFGAKRVPEIAAGIGKGIREFKRNMNDVAGQVREPESGASRLNKSAEPYGAQREEDTRSEPKRLM
jgi:sec-independent protein translocase protein TatA